MTVSEKLTGLFVEMQTIKPLAIFDMFQPVIIDKHYMGLHGFRTLSTLAEENTLHDLAEILVEMYGTKWDSILAQYTASISELKEYSETITETINDTGNTNFTRENTNTVSAFNDENFVNDNQEKETNVTDTGNVRNREYALKKVRDTTAYTELISYLQNNFLCDTLYRDINDLSTLHIFN